MIKTQTNHGKLCEKKKDSLIHLLMIWHLKKNRGIFACFFFNLKVVSGSLLTRL